MERIPFAAEAAIVEWPLIQLPLITPALSANMKQFYIRIVDAPPVRGPFSVLRLKSLANSGELLRHHLISSDQQRWFAASKVKGLVFPDPEDEYELAPTEPTEIPAQEAVPTAQSSKVPDQSRATSFPDPIVPAYLIIPNREQGATLGAAIGLLIIALGVSTCATTMDRSGEEAQRTAASDAALFAGFGASPVVLILCWLGTCMRVDLNPIGTDQIEAKVTTVLAWLPLQTKKTLVTHDDVLMMKIKPIGDVQSSLDIKFFVFMLLLCLLGAIPGLLFFGYYAHRRSAAEKNAFAEISLVTEQNQFRPILLYKGSLDGYYLEDAGEPETVTRIKVTFKRVASVPLIVDDAG